MDWRGWLMFLVVGLVAGWLAGKITRGRGFGLLGNIAVGIAGAFIGGFLGNLLGIFAGSLLGYFLMSTAGAVVLLFIIRIIF